MISRRLYELLSGFDREMRQWGAEDVDLGLKCWLTGYFGAKRSDSHVRHRWQKSFTSYDVPEECIVANRLRTAYKTYPNEIWSRWLEVTRSSRTSDIWHRAWDRFTCYRGTAETERIYLCQCGKHDLYWYAEYFEIALPKSPSICFVLSGRDWAAFSVLVFVTQGIRLRFLGETTHSSTSRHCSPQNTSVEWPLSFVNGRCLA